jgi:hypothetical protein
MKTRPLQVSFSLSQLYKIVTEGLGLCQKSFKMLNIRPLL